MDSPAELDECVACLAPYPKSPYPSFCSKICYNISCDSGWKTGDPLRGPGNPRQLIIDKFAPRFKPCEICKSEGNGTLYSDVCSFCVAFYCEKCKRNIKNCVRCNTSIFDIEEKKKAILDSPYIKKYPSQYLARIFMNIYFRARKGHEDFVDKAAKMGDIVAQIYKIQEDNIKNGRTSLGNKKATMVLAILGSPAAAREIARYWLSFYVDEAIYYEIEGKKLPDLLKEKYWLDKGMSGGDVLSYVLKAKYVSDDKTKLELLEKAIKNKCYLAYGILGDFYFNKNKVNRAIDYYIEGMSKGDLLSTASVSVFMFSGSYGLDQEVEKAIDNLIWVIEHTCDLLVSKDAINYALNWLGSHYLGLRFWTISPPPGTFPIDKQKGIELLKRCNNPQANFFLGKFYRNDKEYGDDKKGIEYLEKSAKMGYQKALDEIKK